MEIKDCCDFSNPGSCARPIDRTSCENRLFLSQHSKTNRMALNVRLGTSEKENQAKRKLSRAKIDAIKMP